MRTRNSLRAGRRAGYSIVELSIATVLFVAVLMASLNVMERDNSLSRSTLGMAAVEHGAQNTLYQLERELSDAAGWEPIAIVTADLGSAAVDSLSVDSTLGFPPNGTLLVERGTGFEERLMYASLDANQTDFVGLVRGQDCTTAQTHLIGTELMWSGLAEPIQLQTNPAPNLWDGQALESGGPVFFRGDGTGFVYRVPTDVNGDGLLIDIDDVEWGATLNGVPNGNAFHALVYVPRATYNEADTGDDINRDGDRVDVFDIGQLRRLTWDASNPLAPPEDLAMGPTTVLQEQCNYGGDLDGDGFDDPLLLWDPDSRELHVRLFLIGTSVRNIPVIRQVETVLFLRNEVEG